MIAEDKLFRKVLMVVATIAIGISTLAVWLAKTLP